MARSTPGRTFGTVTRAAGRVRVHVRKNDTVKVLAGKDRGKLGRVLSVVPDRGVAFVEGVQFVKRHTRPNPSRNIKGGIVEKEGPVHVSNLMVVCPDCKRATRPAYKFLEDGGKIRACRKCGGDLAPRK